MDGEYKATCSNGRDAKEQYFEEKSGIQSVVRNLIAIGYIVTGIFKKEKNDWEEQKER